MVGRDTTRSFHVCHKTGVDFRAIGVVGVLSGLAYVFLFVCTCKLRVLFFCLCSVRFFVELHEKSTLLLTRSYPLLHLLPFSSPTLPPAEPIFTAPSQGVGALVLLG